MLELWDQCGALQGLLLAMQAGSGWGFWVVSLQPSLQSCSGCPQAA